MTNYNVKLNFGDAFEELKKLPTGIANAIITDPPYDFNEEQKNYLQGEFKRICTGAIIIFCPPENRWQPKCDQYLYWVKPISTKNTSKSYSRFVEEIQIWNGQTWNCDRHWSQYTNVFTDIVDNKYHPFQKPYSLIERLVLNHTNKNELVIDPFAGSSTTLLACKRNGRMCIGYENNKAYFDLSKKFILQEN